MPAIIARALPQTAASANERDVIDITKSLNKQRYWYVGNILQSVALIILLLFQASSYSAYANN